MSDKEIKDTEKKKFTMASFDDFTDATKTVELQLKNSAKEKQTNDKKGLPSALTATVEKAKGRQATIYLDKDNAEFISGVMKETKMSEGQVCNRVIMLFRESIK